MTTLSRGSTMARRQLLSAVVAAAGLFMHAAHADDQYDRRHREERYRSPHWVYDDRYHHGRYYPAPGYVVMGLPQGYLSIAYGGGHYYYHGGVWFSVAAGGYVVVHPPLGIVVPVLPPAYDTVWVAGVPYYYANQTYYTAAPGGYVVTAPPAEAQVAPPPAPAPSAAPSAAEPAPGAGAGAWYYCDSAKAFYPYVSDCKEGWRAVSPTPPGVPPTR